MKTIKYKFILLLISLGSIAFTQSCVTNVARTNARIEEGLSGNFIGNYGYTSKDSDGNKNRHRVALEGGVQYGSVNENNLGFSVQAKLGYGSLPSLDLYLQLPSSQRFYYGVGAELGQNDIYIVATYYPTDRFFMTLTGRAGYLYEGFFYNPQLSFGWSRNGTVSPISIFMGYNYFTNEGLNLSVDDNNDIGEIKHLAYAGFQLGF